MFWRLRNRIRRTLYNMQCRHIFDTLPLETKKAPLKLVSMCCHDDLAMYLLAIKSFYQYFGEGTVVVLNDGSLTADDKDTLEKHIHDVCIESISDVSTDSCPQGGTWERLLRIVELTTDCYVIQIDADTLTLAQIPEVVDCYHNGIAFTLGSYAGQTISSIQEFHARIQPSESTHVQSMSEKHLVDIQSPYLRKYVRGCSGFAGFPTGQFEKTFVIDFSQRMTSLLGSKWREWGSEQVTSNVLVANASQAVVLPYPKYQSYWPGNDTTQAAFIHFIGPGRFHKNLYAAKSKHLNQKLLHDSHVPNLPNPIQ